MDNNYYKNCLLDLITIISDRYNNTLTDTSNALTHETDPARVYSELIYYEILDLIYQQLLAFQIESDAQMVEPVIGQKYCPFEISTE